MKVLKLRREESQGMPILPGSNVREVRRIEGGLFLRIVAGEPKGHSTICADVL